VCGCVCVRVCVCVRERVCERLYVCVCMLEDVMHVGPFHVTSLFSLCVCA